VHGTVSVPDGASVRADVGAGDVTAAAVRGDVELGTSAGSVRVARLLGPVRLRADAGTIAAVDLSGSSFEARSGTGNVTASFLRPPSSVDATTDAGTVDLAVPPASYAVDASAGVGVVSVGIPNDPAAPRHILATAAVGQIRARLRRCGEWGLTTPTVSPSSRWATAMGSLRSECSRRSGAGAGRASPDRASGTACLSGSRNTG